jgi:hypothetical protein
MVTRQRSEEEEDDKGSVRAEVEEEGSEEKERCNIEGSFKEEEGPEEEEEDGSARNSSTVQSCGGVLDASTPGLCSIRLCGSRLCTMSRRWEIKHLYLPGSGSGPGNQEKDSNDPMNLTQVVLLEVTVQITRMSTSSTASKMTTADTPGLHTMVEPKCGGTGV